MPRRKAAAPLATSPDFEMEGNSTLPDALPTPESNQENAQPRGKGRGAGKKALGASSKVKSTSRRTSAGTVARKRKVAVKDSKPKRGPLKEQSNNQNPEDTEEVDDFHEEGQEGKDGHQSAVSADELVAVKQPAKKASLAAKRQNQAKRKQPNSEILKQIKGPAKDGEFEYTPVTAHQVKPSGKAAGRPPANKRASLELNASEKVIPDTQDVIMEDKPQGIPWTSDEDEEVPQSVFRRTNNAQSRQRPPVQVHRRAGSASDTERGVGDPAIRRRLGEMTKKFENLDLKYKALKDVGIKEAEANFEKLKTSSEAKSKGRSTDPVRYHVTDFTKAANDLIASLRKELVTQRALAQESRTLQKQLAAKDAEVSKAQALATELSNNLSEAQNENKVLQAKVASVRSASAAIESANVKTPGSAMKNKGPTRTIMVGSAEAAQAAQAAQLKEDLYRDLTGLIVLGLERGGEADTYDCIQTGRNGSKLSNPLNIADLLTG